MSTATKLPAVTGLLQRRPLAVGDWVRPCHDALQDSRGRGVLPAIVTRGRWRVIELLADGPTVIPGTLPLHAWVRVDGP